MNYGSNSTTSPVSTSAPRVFDSIGDVDNETFTDGEVITTINPASQWVFSEAATEGDYSIANLSTGYFNRMDGGVKWFDAPADDGFAASFGLNNTESQNGDFEVGDIGGLNADITYIKRHSTSTATLTCLDDNFVIPANDFDWHVFRKVDDETYKHVGKPFAASAEIITKSYEFNIPDAASGSYTIPDFTARIAAGQQFFGHRLMIRHQLAGDQWVNTEIYFASPDVDDRVLGVRTYTSNSLLVLADIGTTARTRPARLLVDWKQP